MNETHIPLIVFAREFVDQMRYINYPQEWSRSPLNELVPLFIEFLNYHPEKLGDVVSEAYDLTFPVLNAGNVNQLDQTHPEAFKRTKQYYLDEYYANSLINKSPDKPNPIPEDLLRRIALQVIKTFSKLSQKQQNEHRTLEKVCFALEPIYYLGKNTTDMGWELAEYADMWRNVSRSNRKKLYQELVGAFTDE